MERDFNIDEEISYWLNYHKVFEHIEIEEEAKDVILSALSSTDVVKVWIDAEGGLIIEFKEDNDI